MTRPIQLLDVIALTENLPGCQLNRGQVGTVVECLGAGHFEIEFSDNQGRTYAQLAVPEDKLMVLHHQPILVTT